MSFFLHLIRISEWQFPSGWARAVTQAVQSLQVFWLTIHSCAGQAQMTEASSLLLHASCLTELKLDLGGNDYNSSGLWVQELLMACNILSRSPRSTPLTLTLPKNAARGIAGVGFHVE